MLTNEELSWMRDTLEELMPDTCNILSVTNTSDGMGGYTESWGTATANVSCRLDTVQGSYRDLEGAIQTYQKLVLTVPHDTTLTAENRIEHSSVTYQVIQPTAGSWLGVLRAEVEKV